MRIRNVERLARFAGPDDDRYEVPRRIVGRECQSGRIGDTGILAGVLNKLNAARAGGHSEGYAVAGDSTNGYDNVSSRSARWNGHHDARATPTDRRRSSAVKRDRAGALGRTEIAPAHCDRRTDGATRRIHAGDRRGRRDSEENTV